MVECGYGARFAFEAFAELRIRCNMRGQDFDRDIATKASVSCSIDLSHAPRTNERADLVRAETCARRKRHRASVKVGRSYRLSGGEADQFRTGLHTATLFCGRQKRKEGVSHHDGSSL